MAYSIVSVYGMNEKIGNVSFYDSKSSDYKFNKPYSEATAQTIDEEVRKLINFAYERTKDLLSDKREELEKIAQQLLEKEILFQSDLEKIIGKRPFETETSYQAFTRRIEAREEAEALLKEEAENKANEVKKDDLGEKKN